MEGTNVSGANNSSAASVYSGAATMILIKTVSFWWVIFIVPTGITGNILCILVMTQNHNLSHFESI